MDKKHYKKDNHCINCGNQITDASTRCKSCAQKKVSKEGRGAFPKGKLPKFTPFVKKHALGFKKGHEASNSIVKHHIWYKDNEGNLTEKGVMIVSHRHHMEYILF